MTRAWPTRPHRERETEGALGEVGTHRARPDSVLGNNEAPGPPVRAHPVPSDAPRLPPLAPRPAGRTWAPGFPSAHAAGAGTQLTAPAPSGRRAPPRPWTHFPDHSPERLSQEALRTALAELRDHSAGRARLRRAPEGTHRLSSLSLCRLSRSTHKSFPTNE